LTNGTLNGSSQAGNLTFAHTDKVDITAVFDGSGNHKWWRVVMPFALQYAQNVLDLEIWVLDENFTASYTAVAADKIQVAGVGLVLLPYNKSVSLQSIGYDGTTSVTGARWLVKYGTTEMDNPTDNNDDAHSGFMSLGLGANTKTLGDANGWMHGYYAPQYPDIIPGVPSVRYDEYLMIEFHDDENALGQFDMSNLWIGNAWTPSINIRDDDFSIEPWDMSERSVSTPTGQEYTAAHNAPRAFSMTWRYASKADALGDFMALSAKVGKHSPVLVVVDPDEAAYGQELMLYGRATNLQVVSLPYSATLGGTGWGINMRVRELIP
ncbi:MAG: hypothetical protein OES46_19825, partial [Gammaproteobacteria bacterium]|nr:hypothetical protein [Gammaproteobacteria bacterium]